MQPPVFYYACTIVNQGTSYPTVHEGCHNNCSVNKRNHNAQTCEWAGSFELIVFIVRSVMYSWFQAFAMFWMFYAFFWVIPWHMNFICWCFGTLSVPSSQAGRHEESSYLPAYEDGTEYSETSAYKIQTLGNYPEESIQQICNGSSTVIRHQVNVLYWK
jgi:hypothetical protein